MKAGIYLRVSTDMQAKDGESLAEQEATCQAYCNFRNIPIANIYREEGKSGKDTNRPQFQKMIRDCKLGNTDTIIVKKVDRLSRSLIDFEKTIKLFEEQNINLISIQENFDTSSAIGRAVIRIILTFAQLEREQTSERTIDVLKFRAEQGQWNGGYPPLGYDYDKDLGLTINAEESKIVGLIFDKYIELASYRKVAEYINSLGYRTKAFNSRRGKTQGGNKFIDTTIAAILKNPLYTGQIKYKDEIYSGKHQPIIDKEKFAMAQTVIKRNGERKTNVYKINQHNFILEGLVRCGECGGAMAPKWSLAHGRRYFYYECTTVGHGGKSSCGTKAVSAPALESFVLRRIRMIKRDDALLAKIVDNNAGLLEKEISQLESEKILLNIKLSDAAKKSQAIVDKLLTISELSHSQTLYDEVQRLDQEKANIKKQIQEIDFKVTQLKNRSINIDSIKQAFQHFTKVYNKLDNIGKKTLLQLLIKEITFNKDIITINYYGRIDSDELSGGTAPEAGWQRLWTGSSGRTRTCNPLVNSQVLLPLSYRGIYVLLKWQI